MNYNGGKRLIEQKVEDFSTNKAEYMAQGFNETSARSRFIDPLFEALGWNLNQTNIKPHMWDVIREFSDHTITKRPDYAFRINGELKFFVEAKAPHVHLTNKEPVFQAKRYAFSTNGKAPIVILTDFEEFRVFNALKKPKIELPLEGVLKNYDLKYDKYLAKWDLLYEHFSREAVADGALEELKGKLTKKTKTLDREFLEEITQWREMLARNIAIRNTDLTVDELNVSVQRILDRLIFIRNLEDRQIEAEGRLLSIAETKTDIFAKLVPVFRKLDREYNGLLFKKHFSEKLIVDDKVLIHIIKHLSWPLSPYQFDVIEPEILGRIYEKFLGSKIRLTAGHRAKVEEKPEVRKAGGVYYTPQYIVDYIVKNTVGEKIKKKTPEEIKEIKIVDPACGSGSFLLGAFEYLMNYHLEWYGKNRQKRKYKDDWYLTADGEIRLSVRKKAEIMKNNLFGVDIDREATEVSIMSLYLKLLDEGFDKGQAMLFLKGHILPDMTNNIKCGNSLIGSDYFDGQNISLFDSDEAKKVNAFDWEVEFPEVFGRVKPSEGLEPSEGSRSGFDCVIGNPPWGADLDENDHKYFREKYFVAQTRNIDSYSLFIERMSQKLMVSGSLGFITPDTFLRKDVLMPTRKYILENTTIDQLIETGPVFPQVRDTWCLVLVVKNKKPIKNHRINHKKLSRFIVSAEERLYRFGENNWTYIDKVLQSIWREHSMMIIGYRANENDQNIIRKIEESRTLTDQSENYEISRGEEGSKFALKLHASGKFEMIIPENVERYSVTNGVNVKSNSLTELKVKKFYEHPKIWIIRIQKMRWKRRLICSFDARRNTSGMKTLQIIISRNDDEESLKYLLALISSKLLNFWCENYLTDDLNKSYLEKLPIYQIDFDNKKDVSRHGQMVAYVDTMLELNKKLPKLKTEHEKTVIQRQIDATDRKIDKLVYELYDLTEEEVKIVEGVVK